MKLKLTVILSLTFILFMGILFIYIGDKQEKDSLYPLKGEMFLNSVRSLNEFNIVDQGNSYLITHGWIDYYGRINRDEFTVYKEDYLDSIEEFGINYSDMRNYVVNRLNNMARNSERQLSCLDIDFSVSLEEGNALSYSASFSYSCDYSYTNMINNIRNNMRREYNSAVDDYYNEHCFQLINNVVVPDYNKIVQNNVPRLNSLFQVLYQMYPDDTILGILGNIVACVQEFEYEQIPMDENNELIAGLVVPTQIVVENRGDCDSKSALFAALWTHFEDFMPLYIITFPTHAMLLVPVPPSDNDQTIVNLRGETYTAIEIAGNKWYPGNIHERFENMIFSNQYERLFLIE